jgi:hypothetical protein
MANALQEHYGEWLLDRIRADRYPSVNHMNMLEEIASPRLKAEYTLHKRGARVEVRPIRATRLPHAAAEGA